MPVPNKIGIISRYDRLPDEIRSYFTHFPTIAEKFPWDVSISYLFSLVELAHNMTIYCGVVKLHKVNSDLARKAVDEHHMTRGEFKILYKTIFSKDLKQTIAARVAEAEKTRDRILHGKRVSEADKRKAVVGILEYAEALNKEMYEIAGFKPFGPLKGFKGRATPLDRSTSRFVLKGVGLTTS